MGSYSLSTEFIDDLPDEQSDFVCFPWNFVCDLSIAGWNIVHSTLGVVFSNSVRSTTTTVTKKIAEMNVHFV